MPITAHQVQLGKLLFPRIMLSRCQSTVIHKEIIKFSHGY